MTLPLWLSTGCAARPPDPPVVVRALPCAPAADLMAPRAAPVVRAGEPMMERLARDSVWMADTLDQLAGLQDHIRTRCQTMEVNHAL